MVVLLVLATEVLEVLVLEVLALVVAEVVVTVMLTLRSPPVNQITGTQAADLQPPVIIIILLLSSNARYKKLNILFL